MSNYSKYENSIKLIKSIEDDDCIYNIMEYCEMNLDKYIKNRMQENKPLEINEIKNILIQLNNILEILFRNKIAHRDLKPNNILLKFDNEKNFIVKLSDYGNIKQITNSIMTQSNFKGTAIFKAPEILKNEKHYDPIKADLWCIGIIIYFMLKGEYPFISDVDVNKEKEDFTQVILTDEERADLVRQSDSLTIERYIQNISDWQVKKRRITKKAYILIKSWLEEDRAKRKPAKNKGNRGIDDEPSYDIDEWERFARDFSG
jgi:serine/threonine protein kinase